MQTINNKIEFIPQNTSDPTVGLNQALKQIDAILQLKALDLVDCPPIDPSDPTKTLVPNEGDIYLISQNPSGAFTGQADKIAQFLDDNWNFYAAVIALNAKDDKLYINGANGWVKIN